MPNYRNLKTVLVASAALLGVGFAGVALATGEIPNAQVQTPSYSVRQPLSSSDSQALTSALVAAKAGDAGRIRTAMSNITDPLARKVALWALIDTNADGMSYAELDGARRDLAGWPGAAKREAATERVLADGGLSPQATIDWFAGSEPTTAEGAMALASAWQATGQAAKVPDLIRKVWRNKPFSADVQAQMLARFGSMLTTDDHIAREDMLLYGTQGPASKAMLALLPPDQQALANARMAVRSGGGADIGSLPQTLQSSPGLEYELALAAQRRGDTSGALSMIPALPAALPDPDSQSRMWKLRKDLVVAALKAGDSRGAYRAAADSGVNVGGDGAEAEFYAGWIALTRLKDAKTADDHFARLQDIGASPITESRALYWRGRAAEAQGDQVNAQLFYAEAAKYPTAFYGQLASAKVGITQLAIGKDPEITAADRARFNDREPVRAAEMLADIGAKDTFKSFVAAFADTLPTAAEAAQLVDLAQNYGDQSLAMKVVRTAGMHNLILPERGYPLRTPPAAPNAPELPFILGITRVESGFDPHARSGVGATGMMQLMPSTAAIVARRMGASYSGGQLEDADYNMTLGSAFLGQLVDQFSGSYVMAAAAYNAGPGRPTEWTAYCGDPRTSSTDPADYIECIPFSETRNYVMRVLESTEVYRARLHGGTGPLTLAGDLKRGGYGYGPPQNALTSAVSESGTK